VAWDALEIHGRRLGRPDGAFAVYLHGIGGDDFAVETTGELDGQRGFAGRRRPGKKYQGRWTKITHKGKISGENRCRTLIFVVKSDDEIKGA
jgi:hypothetical protein